MPKKPPPNWEEIKTRYCVNGERPSDIAKDYNVAVQTIYNRASQEGWREIQLEIGKEIQDSTIDKRKAFATLAYDTYLYGLTVIARKLQETDNPYRQDGEGLPDAFFLEVMRAARDTLKAEDVKPNDETDPTASRPVYRSVYQDSIAHPASEGDLPGETDP